jgi:serine/threonine protein kinase/dienelactone hydrolase
LGFRDPHHTKYNDRNSSGRLCGERITVAEAPMPEIGQAISHYRISEKIGQGGMGEVFLARDTSLERNVAIKFLPLELRSDPVARDRFLREAKSAATLDHPHICVVHEANEVEGSPFIVMEYVEGESLKARLERGPLPPEQTLQLAAEIAEALQEAHSKHIIHRDLKPANVMITRAGHVKVMDFGLAKRLLSAEHATTEAETITELTQMGTTVGTLAYMSPEQLQGQPVDHRSDIFSFGALLYEMLTSIHPFRKEVGMATAAAILSKDPAPLAHYAPGIPPRLVTLVSAMLAKPPERRPISMGRIHEELKGILLEVQAPPEETGVLNLKRLLRNLQRPQVAIPAAVALLVLVSLGTWFFNHQARVRWARATAIPEIERLATDLWGDYPSAFRLAEQAEKVIPGDPRLSELFSKCSLKINIRTEPPGAKIYMKEYKSPESDWIYLGVTPIEKIRLPIGVFRWKIEKEGYETVLAATSTWKSNLDAKNLTGPNDLVRVMDKKENVPPGMTRVMGSETAVGKLPDFFVDKYEITNSQFKNFINGGGYRERKYWKHPFIKDGKELSWEEAVKLFLDQTGRPGPSTWQAGDYPEGQGDYPVSGISWYEAAAYAEFAGKSLPTAHHWGIARGENTTLIDAPQRGGYAVFAPFNNFKGKGPTLVGSLDGPTPYGAFDMAGNVREWCSNEIQGGRLIRGGAWDDNTYMFGELSRAPAMDRSAKNGFRCALYADPAKIPAAAFSEMKLAQVPDFYKEQPVADSVFKLYRDLYAYDQTDLKARLESRQENSNWIHEQVTFEAAYGAERVRAHLFLPKSWLPPFQTVIYFPGAASQWFKSSQNLEDYYEFTVFLSFIVKSGRAVIYPIYKGTFERITENTIAASNVDPNSYQFTELSIQWVKDLKRSIDYLETRPEIDSRRIAYEGMSWGGVYGLIIPAVEERLKASILIGGSMNGLGRPEINEVNFMGRVKIPTLMLNGRYDTINSLERCIKPAYELLGTPAQDKKLILYETDHIPPINDLIKETLAWFDRYLGPVK